jgi:hypothetical protein
VLAKAPEFAKNKYGTTKSLEKALDALSALMEPVSAMMEPWPEGEKENFEQLTQWVNGPGSATQGAPEKGHGAEFGKIVGTENKEAFFPRILPAHGDAEDMVIDNVMVMPRMEHEAPTIISIPRGMLMEAGSGDDAGADGEHDGARVMGNREDQRASEY